MIHKSSITRTERNHFWISNQTFANTNKEFIEACSRACIEPTARQASKFRMKKGAAYGGRK